MQQTSENSEKRHATDSVLHVQRLKYKIHPVTILKDISFDLKQGEILTLLGPNGAGKSTLLKCLAGLLPHEGEKRIFGETLKRNSSVKKRLGYLGHETFLYLKLSAKENLQFFSELYGIQVDASALLREYQLSEFADQMVETFSRGMKQRLALARALLAGPDLILLDEPFTGLDQQASKLLHSRIIQQKGKTAFVIATHELQLGYEICDRILILKNGRQAFLGLKDEINQEIHEFYYEKTAL